jgi:hypothetical protein
VTESTVSGTSRFAAGAESLPLSLTLLEHHSGMYGCIPKGTWPDGTEIVGWDTDGDHPSIGFVPEPTTGPVEVIPYHTGGYFCKYRGIRVLAKSLVTIEHAGPFGGVRYKDHECYVQVLILQNGVVIASQINSSPAPGGTGFDGFFGTIYINVPDVTAEPGDEFEVSVAFHAWALVYYSTIPGRLNRDTRLQVSGHTLPGVRPFLRGHVAHGTAL